MDLLTSGAQPERASDVLPVTAIPPELNVYGLMDYRRGQVRRREYRPLGLLEKIMFEKSAVADATDANPLAHARDLVSSDALPALAVSLDWYKQGPLLGITPDGTDILICSRMIHPPDLPDPNWIPPYPPTEFRADGQPVPPKPPRIQQRMRDRASGILPPLMPSKIYRFEYPGDGDFWFVCQPVHQVLIILADRTGLAVIECEADATGRHAAFLFNPAREEGHLLFGAKRVEFFRA